MIIKSTEDAIEDSFQRNVSLNIEVDGKNISLNSIETQDHIEVFYFDSADEKWKSIKEMKGGDVVYECICECGGLLGLEKNKEYEIS